MVMREETSLDLLSAAARRPHTNNVPSASLRHTAVSAEHHPIIIPSQLFGGSSSPAVTHRNYSPLNPPNMKEGRKSKCSPSLWTAAS